MQASALDLEPEADIEDVQRKIRAAEELALVKFLFPIRGARPGVQAQLWCTHAHTDPRQAKEQSQRTDKRSVSACLDHLIQLVGERHSGPACIAAAEAARKAAALEAAGAAGPSAPANSFEAMAAAQHVKPAEEKAKVAEKLAAEARAVQRTLEKQLEAANAAVEAAELEAQRLEDEVRFSS